MLFNVYIEVKALGQTRLNICLSAIQTFNAWQPWPQDAWSVSTLERGEGAEGQKILFSHMGRQPKSNQ